MREIRFRAWNKRTKTMIMDVQKLYDGMGDWFDNKGNEIDPYEHMACSSFGGALRDPDLVVEQYTGLKDKNGREIFEGDAVACNIFFNDATERLECKWNDYYAGFFFERDPDLFYGNDDLKALEVVGNIHETELSDSNG